MAQAEGWTKISELWIATGDKVRVSLLFLDVVPARPFGYRPVDQQRKKKKGY
jgi:hypothetical protein